MIELVNVSKRWAGGTLALDSVSLGVGAGEFCVLLGPSGAGKSSLLRTINGLLTPDEGRVRIDGVEMTDQTRQALRKRIGTVHQHFSLSPRLSVASNVLSGCVPEVNLLRAFLNWFTPAQRQRACELLEQVGLSPSHLHQRAGDLSGGQQQRVGVARAFMMKPAVILADEPVASLDPKVAVDILELIHSTAKASGTTVLCSLHQVDLARQFADRIIGLREGRILFDQPASQLNVSMTRQLYEGLQEVHPTPSVPVIAVSVPAFELARA